MTDGESGELIETQKRVGQLLVYECLSAFMAARRPVYFVRAFGLEIDGPLSNMGRADKGWDPATGCLLFLPPANTLTTSFEHRLSIRLPGHITPSYNLTTGTPPLPQHQDRRLSPKLYTLPCFY